MKRGFTLIELLIVVAIIASLMSIAIIGVSGAQKSARDNRRKADLETVRSALELYKADCDRYPASGTNAGNFSFSGASGFKLTGTSAAAGARCSTSNTYLASIPKDPKTGPSYLYIVNGSGTSYSLCSTLEKGTNLTAINCGGSGGTICGGSNNCYYEATNP